MNGVKELRGKGIRVLLLSDDAIQPPAYHRFILCAAHLIAVRMPADIAISSKTLTRLHRRMFGKAPSPVERGAVLATLYAKPRNTLFLVARGDGARAVYFFAGVHYPRLSRALSRGDAREARGKARYCFARLSYAAQFFALAKARYGGDFIPAVTLSQLTEAVKEVKRELLTSRSAVVVSLSYPPPDQR
jgi:hypothetical protein